MLKNLPAHVGAPGDADSIPESGKILWRREWQFTPIFLPGKSHGQRSLVGYIPRGRKESDKTEQLNNDNCLVFASILDCKPYRNKVLTVLATAQTQDLAYSRHSTHACSLKVWP